MNRRVTQPVSRELYESRWNAKFEDLLYNYDFCLPSINPNADEIVQRAEYMFEKFSEWLPVLRYCLIEAKALGLLAERENQETSKKGFSVLDQVSILRFHVQGTAREWRGCMRGGMLGGKVEWVQLERELSGRMAGIIEDVDGLLGFGTGVRGDKGERAKTVEVKRQNSQEIIVRTHEETAWDVAAVERENLLSNISSSGVRSCLRLARVWERSRSLSCKCARADF